MGDRSKQPSFPGIFSNILQEMTFVSFFLRSPSTCSSRNGHWAISSPTKVSVRPKKWQGRSKKKKKSKKTLSFLVPLPLSRKKKCQTVTKWRLRRRAKRKFFLSFQTAKKAFLKKKTLRISYILFLLVVYVRGEKENFCSLGHKWPKSAKNILRHKLCFYFIFLISA